MILVGDIYEDAASRDILGVCDETKVFRYLTRAVEILANKGTEWNPMIGELALCVDKDHCVTLPRDIETPLTVMANGHPMVGRGYWFETHINGPGNRERGSCCKWTWDDKLFHVTFKDPIMPSQLIAFVDSPRDGDGSKSIRVYGYNEFDKWIMTRDCEDGPLVDGFLVPLIYGLPVPNPEVPINQDPNRPHLDRIRVKRITRVQKPVTEDFVRLVALDPGKGDACDPGTLIGYYYPDETEPRYRRIKVSQACSEVTIRYRRRTYKITSKNDLIPLHSYESILTMLQAIRFRETKDIKNAVEFEALAVSYLEDEQFSQTTPGINPVQILGVTLPSSARRMI